MTNPYTTFVSGFEDLFASGLRLTALHAPRPQNPPPSADAPVCLVFSPHPDDEAISGALPWRLRSREGWRVVNVAVTLGSKRERRSARWAELLRCCDYLGFEPVSASGETSDGLERIAPQTARLEPAYWSACAERIAGLVARYRPALIVCPHAGDGHNAHIGTHLLVMDALRQLAPAWPLRLALSEYWNTQPDPGLMVELGTDDVAHLVAALSLHTGEVARNPYHLTLPAFFIDSVRRGAERVGAPGSAAPDFRFACLYGWMRWSKGRSEPLPSAMLPLRERLNDSLR